MIDRKTIETDLPVGTEATLITQFGREHRGVIEDYGETHMRIKKGSGETTTLLIGSIAEWTKHSSRTGMGAGSDAVRSAATASVRPAHPISAGAVSTYSEASPTAPVHQATSAQDASANEDWIRRRTELSVLMERAELSIPEPILIFPEKELPKKPHLDPRKLWDRARNVYIDAKRIHELGTQYGRIGPKVSDLRELSTAFPESPSAVHFLAFYEHLAGNTKAALDHLIAHLRLKPDSVAWAYVPPYAAAAGDSALALACQLQCWKNAPKHVPDDLKPNWLFAAQQTVAHRAEAEWLEFTRTSFDHLSAHAKAVVVDLTCAIFSALQSSVDAKRFFLLARSKPIEHFTWDSSFFAPVQDGATSSDAFKQALRTVNEITRPPVTHKPAVMQRSLEGFSSTGTELAKAKKLASRGIYDKALGILNRLIFTSPAQPELRTLQAEWKRRDKIKGIPKDSGAYARAKHAHLAQNDHAKAVRLFEQAIRDGDKPESAVKDLASLLGQMGHPDKAVEALRAHKGVVPNHTSWENALLTALQAAGRFSEMAPILERRIAKTANPVTQRSLRYQLGITLSKGGEYSRAEQLFRELLNTRSENPSQAVRALALCLSQQERKAEAIRLLDEHLAKTHDAAALVLRERIQDTSRSGVDESFEAVSWESLRPDLGSEAGPLAAFFLQRCQYEGLAEPRKQQGDFSDADISNLEGVIGRLGKGRPRDRAKYSFTAAKISDSLGNDSVGRRFLARAFASLGDASIAEGKPLDAARDAYSYALRLFDDIQPNTEGGNTLCRYLLSFAGRQAVPLGENVPSVSDAVGVLCNSGSDTQKSLLSISLLAAKSPIAATVILQSQAIQKSLLGVLTRLTGCINMADISSLCKEWVDWALKKTQFAADSLGVCLSSCENSDLKASVLQHTVAELAVNKISDWLISDLDRSNIQRVYSILDGLADLDGLTDFEAKERLLEVAHSQVVKLSDEIADAPTGLSTGHLLPFLNQFSDVIQNRRIKLIESSAPRLTCRLADGKNVYAPDANSLIEVQVVVSNADGCSPADRIVVRAETSESLVASNVPDVRLANPLRSGQQVIIKFPLVLTEDTRLAGAFTLMVRVSFESRTGEVTESSSEALAVRLAGAEEFEQIRNPYTPKSGQVEDPSMFFGRSELIERAVDALEREDSIGRCFLLYGQKRVGKSSVLFHLRRALENHPSLLPIDIGNIAVIVDLDSHVAFIVQFAWNILHYFQEAIVSHNQRFPEYGVPFEVADRSFFESPVPLQDFNRVLGAFKKANDALPAREKVHPVILIDEFSYIYNWIVEKRLPDTFMKTWKAWLQAGYFSAVLVGQDVMPKFRDAFPNEFGVHDNERVSYLGLEAARDLADLPIRIGGPEGRSRYRERALERLLELSGHSPFYLQILCDRLVVHMNRKKMALVTEADVEDVVDELLRGNQRLDATDFDGLVDDGDTSPDKTPLEVVWHVVKQVAFASTSNGGAAPKSALNLNNEGTLMLDALIDRDVLVESPPGYIKIRVALFNQWIICNLTAPS